MPRLSKSGAHRLALKDRQERALQLRRDGLSLRAIGAEVGMDASNVARFFDSYKSESILHLHEELFQIQTERLMELWRAAAEAMRTFVPVLDSNGDPIRIPVLDVNGEQVLDDFDRPMTELMRDYGVHLNAVNVAARITERIAKHFGLDAPDKRLMLSEDAERQITFRVIDARDGAVSPVNDTSAPYPMPPA